MFVLALVLFFVPALLYIVSNVRKRLQVDAPLLTKMYGWFAASLGTLASLAFLNGAVVAIQRRRNPDRRSSTSAA